MRVSEVLGVDPFCRLGCGEEELCRLVEGPEQERFQLSTIDGELAVRAVQGHSMECIRDEHVYTRLHLKDRDLPVMCVHGTFLRHQPSIERNGLLPGGYGEQLRHGDLPKVHIHMGVVQQRNAGANDAVLRRGSTLVVYVDIRKAMKDGIKFYRTDGGAIITRGNRNGVLKPKYLTAYELLDGPRPGDSFVR